MEGLIVGGILVKLRSAVFGCFLRVYRCRQHFIGNVNGFQGVLGLGPGFRDHHCYGVSHITHDVFGDGGIGHRFNIGVRDHPRTGDRVQHAIGVGAGIGCQHSWSRLGRAYIYADYSGMSVGAAQNSGVDQSMQFYVVGVSRLTGDQAGVFPAADS